MPNFHPSLFPFISLPFCRFLSHASSSIFSSWNILQKQRTRKVTFLSIYLHFIYGFPVKWFCIGCHIPNLFNLISIVFSHDFLTTQCIRIPLRISIFSTFNPAFLQHSVTVSFVVVLTSPCPHKFASGSSIWSISQTKSLFSLVTSRRINLPPGRRHRLTLSKNPCGSG